MSETETRLHVTGFSSNGSKMAVSKVIDEGVPTEAIEIALESSKALIAKQGGKFAAWQLISFPDGEVLDGGNS